eukprot:m.73787 g.73787  ORF g.73787 m.73787 type:complete len:63 (+) comp12433_c0_seq4:861-1049(+)
MVTIHFLYMKKKCIVTLHPQTSKKVAFDIFFDIDIHVEQAQVVKTLLTLAADNKLDDYAVLL